MPGPAGLRQSPVDFPRYASIGRLADSLRAGEISAGKLAAETIATLHSTGRQYNAVAALMPQRAAEEATRAEALLAAGNADILCGVPYGAKDLFAARGAPTTWGIPALRDQVFTDDATAISRLSALGAVLAAKLTSVSFAGVGRPTRPGASLHGQGRNPWNVDHYAGGSSSGSAIAVSLGLVPFALGTETGGSVLLPAAWSGVTGVRSTVGSVPTEGVMVASRTLDKVGVLARSAVDCELVLERLAGSERAAESTHEDQLRVGWDPEEDLQLAPGAGEAIRRMKQLIAAHVGKVVPTSIPGDRETGDAITTIMLYEAAAEHRDRLNDPTFHLADEDQDRAVHAALAIPTATYDAALRARAGLADAFARLFDHLDVIVASTTLSTAPRLDEPREARDIGSASGRLMTGANLVGLPGVSVPAGLAANGMPMGIHLVGPRGSDRRLLALAKELQSASDHHLLRPPDIR